MLESLRNLGDTRVRDVMSAGVTFAYEDNSVEEAVVLMSEHQVRRLPVLDRNKRLVGIVALGDLVVEHSAARPAGEALAQISKSSRPTLGPPR
ncbi:MAG TPA: CBS domain-containing protein [Gammaproteobacteria bacterium]|nr:CBS domain-containing protein [Gammaproteobacteria bacterium]